MTYHISEDAIKLIATGNQDKLVFCRFYAYTGTNGQLALEMGVPGWQFVLMALALSGNSNDPDRLTYQAMYDGITDVFDAHRICTKCGQETKKFNCEHCEGVNGTLV